MESIAKTLNALKQKGLYREFRTISSSCSSTVNYKGKKYIMLASNNYFGLNTHPKVISAAKNALLKYGSGNAASRLIVNLGIHSMLEKEIAKYKGCEAAMAYSSGFAANLGIISSIAGENDTILSDELNHASIIDGCKLSKADVMVYRHSNINHLESLLKKSKSKRARREKNKRILVVTDALFSMDGDVAKLKEISGLKKRHNFMLMVDNAHSTGVIDTNFKGIDIHMGTLSKALGSQGGYVAGSSELIDFFRNFSRPFIYSTGLSPADAASALAALKIIKTDSSLKKRLLENASYMRNGLVKQGFAAGGELQIIPIAIGDNKKAMQLQRLLEKDGIFVTGVRPPTVKSAMLRVSVMSTHTRQQLDKALKAFRNAGAMLGLANLTPHLAPRAQK